MAKKFAGTLSSGGDQANAIEGGSVKTGARMH